MHDVQWYYARDEQRFGPVSTVELKRLAEHGQLAPGDLVWREGMSDWAEASHVKGLFHAAPAERAAPTATGAAPPIRPGAEPTQPVTARPRKPFVHPVAAVLSLARRNASEAFVDSSIRLFVLAGQWAMVAAMLLVVAAGAAVSLHEKSPVHILIALGVVPVLAVLQYAAGQFCGALDRVNRSTRAAIASTTLLDLLGIVGLLLGLVLLFGITAQAISLSNHATILAALLAFILCEHWAAVSLVHVDQNVIVADNLSPGEEALGTLCALLKTSARVVPVAFGAGVCWGTLLLVVACVHCLRGGEAVELSWGVTLLQVTTVALFAAIPMLGYVLFLLLALVFDVLDGLLTLRRDEE
ncbi:MAG: DUF4339 domain-containing protein [Pirellulales bacterium]|nr:DUF4339 domain-containing protein [Pirellulales bacterium]